MKSIAVQQNLSVLEVRPHGLVNGWLEELQQLCGRYNMAPELIAHSGNVAYLGVKNTERLDRLQFAMEGCLEVRLHRESAILTLVGSAAPEISARIAEVLKNSEAVVISNRLRRSVLTVVIPQSDLRKSLEALHREFFGQVDPAVFAQVERPLGEPVTASRPVGNTAPRTNGRLVLAHR